MPSLDPNDALIDYAGVLKTVGDLQDRFSLLNFLDYCAIVEGLVLHERLVMVGATPHAQSEESGISQKIVEKLKDWIDAGVLVFDESPSAIQDVPAQLEDLKRLGSAMDRLHRTGAERRGEKAALGLEDAWFESSRIIAAEKSRGRPALPLLRQAPYYEKSALVPEDHAVCDLVARYSSLKNALEALRDQSRVPAKPYLAVPVPPLALQTLQRCKSPDDLLQSALETRERYAKLRASLRQLRSMLLDPDLAPEKRLAHIESWERSWKTLEEYDRRANLLQLANSSNDILNANNALDDVGLDAVKWSKVVQKSLEKGEKSFYRWRVRMLHRTAKQYLATSDLAVNKSIRDVFDQPVGQTDVQQVKAFCDALREPEVPQGEEPLPGK